MTNSVAKIDSICYSYIDEWKPKHFFRKVEIKMTRYLPFDEYANTILLEEYENLTEQEKLVNMSCILNDLTNIHQSIGYGFAISYSHQHGKLIFVEEIPLYKAMRIYCKILKPQLRHVMNAQIQNIPTENELQSMWIAKSYTHTKL